MASSSLWHSSWPCVECPGPGRWWWQQEDPQEWPPLLGQRQSWSSRWLPRKWGNKIVNYHLRFLAPSISLSLSLSLSLSPPLSHFLSPSISLYLSPTPLSLTTQSSPLTLIQDPPWTGSEKCPMLISQTAMQITDITCNTHTTVTVRQPDTWLHWQLRSNTGLSIASSLGGG